MNITREVRILVNGNESLSCCESHINTMFATMREGLEHAASLFGCFWGGAGRVWTVSVTTFPRSTDHEASERVAPDIARARMLWCGRCVRVDAVTHSRSAAIGSVATGRPVPHPGILSNRCQQQAISVNSAAPAVALAVVVPRFYALPARRDVPHVDDGNGV